MERKEREKGKGEKKRKEKQEREREGEERERGGRKGSRRSDSRNSLDQGVKSGDSTRGYTSRGRNSAYFGFTSSLWAIVFGLILEPCCAMLMVWDEFEVGLKGCYRSEFGLKIAFTGVAKMLLQGCNPRARYCVD